MKKAIAVGLLTLAVTLPAFADNPRRRIQFYDNSGTLQELDNFNDPAKFALLMKHARKVAPGSIVVTSDGQMYILQDFKMPNGEMMSKQLTQH